MALHSHAGVLGQCILGLDFLLAKESRKPSSKSRIKSARSNAWDSALETVKLYGGVLVARFTRLPCDLGILTSPRVSSPICKMGTTILRSYNHCETFIMNVKQFLAVAGAWV